MKKLSGFDLGMIIAFSVVALLGGGAWWYLSGKLSDAQANVSAAASDFDKYSSKEVYLPTSANEKIVQANIDLMKAQIDPLVQAKLESADNKIFAAAKQDPVAWKHDLDERVNRLNTAAKVHAVAVAPNFYYGFSRYLNTNPGDDKTMVLTKQLLGIEQISDILINDSVKAIPSVRRTYEEDDSFGGGGSGARSDKDYLPGHSTNVDGGIYTAYPFEFEFEATTDSFRKVVNDLVQSPYVFVIRSVTLQNSKMTSPQISELDKIAAEVAPQPAPDTSTPGAAATDAKPPTVGPRFLFGGETLHIRIKLDMIEWKGVVTAEAPSSGRPARNRPSPTGDN